MEFLSTLNKKQHEAVTHDVGPVFVIAGAGTGKTKTLTMRIAYLIALGYDPKHILAVTFTNKAAREMKSRIIDLIGPSGSEVWMYTFHAFGLQILRRHIGLLPYGYTTNFIIIDETSMLDINLAASLLRAVPINAQILFVGDVDQLPQIISEH